MGLTTPVAIFLFNRPEHTARVFAEIAKAKPDSLLLIADGPPNEADQEACQASRRIVEAINWTCDVRRNFSDVNLGCRRRMSSGIDWVFSLFDRAILLEDDCIPHPTFFPFCAELLDRHQNDEQIMMISGDNMQLGQPLHPIQLLLLRNPPHLGLGHLAKGLEALRRKHARLARGPGLRFPGRFRLASRRPRSSKSDAGRSRRPHQHLGRSMGIRLLETPRAKHPPRGQPGHQYWLRRRRHPYPQTRLLRRSPHRSNGISPPPPAQNRTPFPRRSGVFRRRPQSRISLTA